MEMKRTTTNTLSTDDLYSKDSRGYVADEVVDKEQVDS